MEVACSAIQLTKQVQQPCFITARAFPLEHSNISFQTKLQKAPFLLMIFPVTIQPGDMVQQSCYNAILLLDYLSTK
ncbi:hypothetical protein D3C76_1697460 [compost metagenome]